MPSVQTGGIARPETVARSVGLSTVMKRADSKSAPPNAGAGAFYESYTRVSEALRNAMGDIGRRALLARALACTEDAHPILKELRIAGDGGPRREDISASIEAHGPEDVAAAVNALIEAVHDILTRLIGADMTRRLIDDDARRPHPPAGAHES